MNVIVVVKLSITGIFVLRGQEPVCALTAITGTGPYGALPCTGMDPYMHHMVTVQ